MTEITDSSGQSFKIHPGAKVFRAKFLRQNLRNVDFSGCTFENCFFNESDLSDANFSSCTFIDCSFFRTNISGTDLRNSKITDCYWKDSVHTNATKWPVEFAEVPEATSTYEDSATVAGAVWKSLLGSPGLIKSQEFSHSFVQERKFLTARDNTQFLTLEESKSMLARLAFHMFIASKYCYIESQGWGTLQCFFTEHVDENDWENEPEIDELLFSTYVLLLLFLRLRFHQVLDAERVLVSFEPYKSVQEFSESDLFKVFRFAAERELMLRPEDEEVPEKISEILALDPALQCLFQFAEIETNDEQNNPIHDLIEEFLFLVENTTTTLVGDEESQDDDESIDDDEDFDDEDEDEDESSFSLEQSELSPDHPLCTLMLGIQSIEKVSTGRFSAVLKPEVDFLRFLEEQDQNDDDDDEEEEVVLEDELVEVLNLVGIPSLGVLEHFLPTN
jgi:hypothetical protein